VDTGFISGYYGGYTSDSPDWQQLISVSQTAPALAVYAKAEVRFYDISANWTGSATVYIDDALFEDVTTADAVIVDAYTISTTAMDVLYDKDITSVVAGDYSLTGTASITFSSASIDGTNAKLVHLSGASTPMVGDITLDNMSDLNNTTDLDFYAGIMPIAFCNTNNPGGTMLVDHTATFQGIVSANDEYNNVWVSDAAGQYNGVMIYDSNFDGLVAVGDEIVFYGQRAVYNNISELVNPGLISTLSTGNLPYGPTVIDGSDIEYTIAADTDPAEPWEGQLVKIDNFTVDSVGSYSYWCSWSDSKATYVFNLGDNVDYHLSNISLTVGSSYSSITGVVDWYYSGPYYRINPRDQFDIEGSVVPATQLAIISVNGGSDPYENTDFSVVVQAQDAGGSPALVTSDVDFAFTTDGGTSGIVAFVGGTTTTGTIAIGTSEVTVTGVQMAPAGTNVTITANDDASALTSGQSTAFEVLAAASYIIYQGFEQTGDTWNYTPDPTAYNTGTDVWDSVASVGSISSPAVGDRFWGIRDIDNPIDSGWHTIILEPVDISSYSNVELSFQYYTNGFDGPDEIGYVVEFDNGTAWNDTILLDKDTDMWTTISVVVPGGSDFVRLQLLAIQDGGSDYAGWDDIKLVSTSVNPAYQLAIISVNGGTDPYENTDFEVVVQAQDVGGAPAPVDSDVDFTFTTDGGNSGTVDFTGGSSTGGTITLGTSVITITGVQMAPFGTNVTITAVDDFGFGLVSGTSDAFDVLEFNIPDVIITEIMQNPDDVYDDMGEWFEVYNNTASNVDMAGWTITNDGSENHVITGSVIVPSYGFAVLSRNSDSGTNGGYTSDYQYSGFVLGNGSDKVVLIFSDGITEVDRVEYDGGAVWPDPTGSSMAYTGFVDEDNNDGTKWVWATFRESTYPTTGSDRGSPGTNGFDQILTGGFKLDLKVYLESPFISADSMSNAFRQDGILPLIHPFNPATPYYGNNNPAWQYSGYDTLGYVRYGTVDWLLVELRDASNPGSATTIVAQQPALLSDNGTIVSMNGYTALNFSTSFTNNMYIVVWNMSHLGIMSSAGFNPVNGDVISYDFSTGSAQVYGGATGYKDLGGVWGMASGDINGDKAIDGTDNTDGWATEAGEEGGYQGTNLNIDGQIENKDKNEYLVPNDGMNSGVPN